jgi:TonB family protein
MVVALLAVGMLGLGVYRLIQRASPRSERHPEELVDFADSVETKSPALPPDDSTFELSAVEALPELLNRGEVQAALSRNYPPVLRDAGVTGSVTLRMRVRSDGSVDVSSITVEESTHFAFSEAAKRVAMTMRFRPARAEGKLVPVWVTLPVTFQLAR